MASPLLLNFPFGVLLAFSQRRHCEETQIRIQLIKQLSGEKVGWRSQGAAQKIFERLCNQIRTQTTAVCVPFKYEEGALGRSKAEV